MLIHYDVDNTVQIFREIPFFRPQNDTERTVKWLKIMTNDMRGEVTYLFVVDVFSTCRKTNINFSTSLYNINFST